MTLWTIRAQYDDEAHVWYSVEGDLPGFAADSHTIEGLVEKAAAMLPDLLANHHEQILDRSRLKEPHAIRVIAFHEAEYPVAA
jgi:hypothetical protein